MGRPVSALILLRGTGTLLRRENSQRKIPDDILAFVRRQAMHGEKDLVDGLADRHVVADQKDPRHRLARRDSGISETRNRSAIMGEEKGLVRRPTQESRDP